MGALPRGWHPLKFWTSTFQWTHPKPQDDLRASHRGPRSHCHLRGITTDTGLASLSGRLFDPPPANRQMSRQCPRRGSLRVCRVPRGAPVHWGSGQKTCARVCFLVAARQPGHFLETCGDKGLNTLPGTPYPQPFSPTMGGNPYWPCPQGHHRVHGAWLPTWRCCRQQAWQRRKSQEGHLKKTTSSALQPAHATPAARGLM